MTVEVQSLDPRVALLRVRSQRGIGARIARQLGVSPMKVSRVINGYSRNDAIEKAVTAELGCVDAMLTELAASLRYRHEAALPPLSAEQRSQFRRGCRYFGLQSSLAKEFHCSAQNVRMVLDGAVHNDVILQAAREAMARIDAALATSTPPLHPNQ